MSPLRVALVAGEASGDTLGAGLIEALRRREPDAQFFGVAGPKMRAAGCEMWEPAESLAVMGLVDVLRELPRLVRLISRLRSAFIAARPDVFVGIDAPDTNLRLARKLHRAGIPTVQYVSPQVWAWRQGRVHSMHESVDLVLCLLPFEQKFYENRQRARPSSWATRSPTPFRSSSIGSRRGPVSICRRRGRSSRSCPEAGGARSRASRPTSREPPPGSRRIAPAYASSRPWRTTGSKEIFSRALKRLSPQVEVRLIDGQAQRVLIASDAALIASGTASLEAALCKRPMVVVYRTGAITAFALKHLKLVKSKFFAQPNLLADRRVVGEYFQEQVDPPALGAELSMWLDDAERRAKLEQEFVGLHVDLKRNASERAAQAIIDLLRRRAVPAVTA